MPDEFFMQAAIKEAKKALAKNEVPIGAVAVVGDKIIARAHNIREKTSNPLGHAELLLLQKLTRKRTHPSWRFDNVTIYVTCKPCMMCKGALLLARIKRLVYASPGAISLNHKIVIRSGIYKDECAKLLSGFFRNLRK